jgi:hypothetical protein
MKTTNSGARGLTAHRTIVFVDEHQDFLEWDVNKEGVVIACRPFQSWVWTGTKVLNENIKPGDKLQVERRGHQFTLVHPVREVK